MTDFREKIARALAEWHGGPDAEPWVYDMHTYSADAVLVAIASDLDKVRAVAWDEGHESAAMRVPGGVWHDVAAPHPGNPYRKAEQEVAP